MRRFLSFFALGFIVFTIWIVHEADVGRKNVFLRFVDTTPHADKFGHFFIVGTLTLAVNFLLNYRSRRLGKFVLPLGSLIVLLVALTEESSQYFIETRNLELLDAIVNTIAVLVFSIPAFLQIRRARKT